MLTVNQVAVGWLLPSFVPHESSGAGLMHQKWNKSSC